MKPLRTSVCAVLLLLGAAAPPPAPGPGGPSFLPQLVPMPKGLERIEAGDLDGDGDLDLVAMTGLPSGARAIVLSNDGGTFTPTWAITLPPTIPNSPVDLEVDDLDGDLDLDLLLNVPYAANEVRLNAGDGTFPTSTPVPAFGRRVDNELGDLDGDGDLDIAYYEIDIIGYVGTNEGQGDGTFAFGSDVPGGGNDGDLRAALGEVSGDGRLDLVLASRDGLQLATGAAVGTAPGWQFPVTTIVGGTYLDVAVGDLDGDLRDDVVAAAPDRDAVAVLLGQAGGGLGAPVDYPTGPRPQAIAIADVGCGPAPDLAVVDGRRGILGVLIGEGDGTFQPPVEFFVGRSATDVTAGDHDGDGDTDLFVTSAGRVVVLVNQELP